jgi:putative hydrolase of the HAD superfamily
MSFRWDDDVALGGSRAGLAALARDGLPEAEAISGWFAARPELFANEREDETDFAAVTLQCFAALGCDLDDDGLRTYLQAQHDRWETVYSVPPAAHTLLEELRARGLKLAIVSNTALPRWLLQPVFERQGLADRVDAIVLSSDTGKRKPHPAIFERALAELGVAPRRALFVGDRVFNDVRGAAAVGMTSVQALWFSVDEDGDGPAPDHRAHAMLDVLEIAAGLRGRET